MVIIPFTNGPFDSIRYDTDRVAKCRWRKNLLRLRSHQSPLAVRLSHSYVHNSLPHVTTLSISYLRFILILRIFLIMRCKGTKSLLPFICSLKWAIVKLVTRRRYKTEYRMEYSSTWQYIVIQYIYFISRFRVHLIRAFHKLGYPGLAFCFQSLLWIVWENVALVLSNFQLKRARDTL